MLERLRAHPIFSELDFAECHHEIPYYSPEGRGIIDLLYRHDASWFILDFKTDEVRSEEEARETIRRVEYDHQMWRATPGQSKINSELKQGCNSLS